MHKIWPLIVVSVIFILSLIGAYVLFNILESTADTDYKGFKLGGAVAGFISIYYVLNRHYSKLSKPILTRTQTLHLLDYWSKYQANAYKEWFFSALDRYAQNADDDLSERLRVETEAIKIKSHRELAEFETPLGNLSVYIDKKYNEEEFQKDMTKLYKILNAKEPASEIRYKIIKFIDSRREMLLLLLKKVLSLASI